MTTYLNDLHIQSHKLGQQNGSVPSHYKNWDRIDHIGSAVRGLGRYVIVRQTDRRQLTSPDITIIAIILHNPINEKCTKRRCISTCKSYKKYIYIAAIISSCVIHTVLQLMTNKHYISYCSATCGMAFNKHLKSGILNVNSL